MGLRRYTSIGNQNAVAGGASTIMSLTSATTIRPHLYTVILGSAATPADQAFNVTLQRHTAAGTSTAFTPIAHDPANPAALAAAGYNHTVEPTLTASAYLAWISFNQQATFAWAVDPEFGLVAPATAANGISTVFLVVSGGTALTEETYFHQE